MMNSITTRYFTKNPCYRQGRTIQVKGLMLHSVGCPQPDPEVFAKNWDRPEYNNACVHGFIGAEKTIIGLPCMETKGKAMRGWHGGGSSNNTHLGFEMTEPACIKYVGGSSFTCSDLPTAVNFVRKTTRNAVELFAQLCTFHGLDPLLDIVSHAEGYTLGIATNHADPEHLWRQLGMDYCMDDFRRDVAEKMEGENIMGTEEITSVAGTGDNPSDWAREATEYCKEHGIFAGDGNGNYGWQRPITREAVAQIVYNILHG